MQIIRRLAGDLMVDESLIVEVIYDSAELTQAWKLSITDEKNYAALLELLSEEF